ncbi:MAG: VOC family protein [Rhodocyclaceae bacterium]|jgi:catechol 2,3-dioxygenase-like lactoylglutathione lyase family enzyme|nr:VOC family protein [Rhodocyclaceae bacterium]
MIGYVTVGTNNLPRALDFYDALFDSIGGSRILEEERSVAWSFGPAAAAFGVTKPFNGEPASVGNGVMVALSMSSQKNVEAIYKLALTLGATDEGAPGPRGNNFYAAYFRDLDGNKLCAFFMK